MKKEGTHYQIIVKTHTNQGLMKHLADRNTGDCLDAKKAAVSKVCKTRSSKAPIRIMVKLERHVLSVGWRTIVPQCLNKKTGNTTKRGCPKLVDAKDHVARMP